MQGIRRDIDQDLEDVSASARNLVDWKHYVNAYPWLCLGAAAALGFLVVPKRSAAAHADLTTPVEPVSTGRPEVDVASVAAPAVPPSVARGVFDALVGAVVGVAVREAVAYLGQNAERLLGMTTNPRTNHHDSTHAS